ncbi:hypothetical protein [Sphingobium sp. R-7]|uniref:hypothetical protein n=1 Tax=Sphingobium sp. R-7 TaxID=3375449 RepID=UPI00398B30D3
MTPATSLTKALAALKPGDTYTLPDGDIVGNITLPRGLSGSKGKPITIRGGMRTRIIATDKAKPAFGGGGCKWLRLMDFETVGGRDGVHIGQNGDDYDPAKMIEQIYVVRVKASGHAEDGIKLNGGAEAHVHSCSIEGGRDQGIDLLGIRGGSVRKNIIKGSPCAIVAKGGCVNIDIIGNQISDCVDGVHIGERTAPRWQAPWTDRNTVGVRLRGNKINVTGNPVSVAQSDEWEVDDTNALWTSKRAKGQMARLVEVYG